MTDKKPGERRQTANSNLFSLLGEDTCRSQRLDPWQKPWWKRVITEGVIVFLIITARCMQFLLTLVKKLLVRQYGSQQQIKELHPSASLAHFRAYVWSTPNQIDQPEPKDV